MAPTPQPYRAKDGTVTWYVRYRIKGRPNPTKDTFGPYDDDPDGERARVEAEKFARLVERVGGEAARATRRSSEDSARTMPTLATWLERHLEQVAASATPGTVAEYRRTAARTWLPRLGALPLDAITRDACVSWVAWQREQTARRTGEPYSTKSIANAARLLSSVMASAVEAELISKNPAARLPMPSDQERREMVFLTANELARLIDAIPEHWRPLVAFLFGTGMRWGEATALRGGDFDLDAQPATVRIVRAWKKGAAGVYLGAPKSKAGRRTITIDDSLAAFIRPLVEAAGRDGLVFTSRTGQRAQTQHFHSRIWQPALKRAQLGKRPRVHDARHSHVAALIAQGVGLPVIRQRLGHESIKTTIDVYGHLLPDLHAGAAEAAGAYLSGALPVLEGGAEETRLIGA